MDEMDRKNFSYTFEQYQEAAERTSRFKQRRLRQKRLMVTALGLAGEAGEVADLVKKHVGHGHELDTTKVIDEIGDVLWYVSEMASALGCPLEDVALINEKKLRKRYPKGFSSAASRNRKT